MVRSYRFTQWLVLAIFLAVGSIGSALAQLSLISASPADGSVNVASQSTFELTFSAALDTNARFQEPQDFFLNIEVLPEDAFGEPEEISVSADLKTLTVSGFSLQPETSYTVLLTGAKSMTGDLLDRPYVWTFTTSATLPSGSVSGQTILDGNPAPGAVVALSAELFQDEVQHLAVATPNFTINYVPDGFYYPISVMDTNDDGYLNPTGGDAVGLYDANADGQPDVIEISNGAAVTGVDLTLTQPVARTARTDISSVGTAAQAWAVDAVLVAINSDNISEDGQAIGWSFTYYSASQQGYREFFSFGSVVIEETPEENHDFGTDALPDNWVDSQAVLATAEANGGADFRANFPDTEVFAALHYWQFYHDENENSQNSAASGRFTKHKRLFVNSRVSSSEVGENLASLAVWRVHYNSKAAEEYFGVEINAQTGSPLASDARSNLSAADQAAQQWASDADLIQVLNQSWLFEDGLSVAWGYAYQSATLDSTLQFVAVSGKVLGLNTIDFGELTILALPAQFCNSTEALSVAQQESESFRAQHPGAHVTAQLMTGLGPDPNRAVWRIGYHTLSDDHFEVEIDAENCILTTSVHEDADLPATFALDDNYPNPFNPTTQFSYRLPSSAHVQIDVYNLLGQKVKSLVNDPRTAGIYEIRWDGTNDVGQPAPSGIYVYQLQAGDFTTSKKMLLLR